MDSVSIEMIDKMNIAHYDALIEHNGTAVITAPTTFEHEKLISNQFIPSENQSYRHTHIHTNVGAGGNRARRQTNVNICSGDGGRETDKKENYEVALSLLNLNCNNNDKLDNNEFHSSVVQSVHYYA